MAEESPIPEHQNVRLLSPDDEQARLIGKAIASETAGKILSSMAGREVTATVLSDELAVPVSTIMYHLDNLVAAGLVEISRTRYSVKGREMKVYGLVDQVLIVSSGKQDLKSVLARCITLSSIPLAIASILAFFALNQNSVANVSTFAEKGAGGAAKLQMDTACYSLEEVMEVAPAPDVAVPSVIYNALEPTLPFLDIALGIIIGAFLVILTGLFIDYIKKR